MPIRGLGPSLVLLALGASLLLSPSSGGSRDPSDTHEMGCLNVEYDYWGGPIVLRPYVDEIVGIVLSEDVTADGMTAAVLVVPSLCGNGSTNPAAQIMSTSLAFPSVPSQSPDAGLAALP